MDQHKQSAGRKKKRETSVDLECILDLSGAEHVKSQLLVGHSESKTLQAII